MTEPTRILVADDHAILRAGLRLLIENEPNLKVVGEAADGEEALTKAIDLQPDLILLDINMPGLDGLSALPHLKELAPDTRILILTMHDDVRYLQQALEYGASGYVLKKVVDNELLMAIQAVVRGETYVHSAMTGKLLQVVNKNSPPQEQPNPWQELSEREYDVLRMVALGHTNGEIASELFLSVKTVETYRARGMEKLDIQTRAQLVKSALQHGILE